MLLLLFPIAGKAQQFSLEECLKLGSENNADFKIQTLKVEQKMAAKRSFAHQFLPEIGISASHAYNFGSSIDPATNNRLPSNIQSNNFSLDARMQLFDFSKWYATDIQKLDIEIEKAELEVIENQFNLLILEKYIKGLSLQEWALTRHSQVENSAVQLQRIEKEVAEGRRPQSDLYDINVIYLQDKTDLEETSQKEILAKLELLQLLNTYDINAETLVLSVPEPSTKEVHIITDEHPALKKYSLFQQKSAKEYRQLISNVLPSLGLNYSYGTFFAQKINNFSDTRFQFGNQLKENKSHYIGVSLYIPVFNKDLNRQKRHLKLIEQQGFTEESIKESKRLDDFAAATCTKIELLKKSQQSLQELREASLKSFATTESRYLFAKTDASVYKSAKNQLLLAQYNLLLNQLDQVAAYWSLKLTFESI